jgi:hypothetical protein
MKQISFVILVLLSVSVIFTGLVFAGLDQSYYQVVDRNGSSTILKSQDISILSSGFPKSVFDGMTRICAGTPSLKCAFNNQTMILDITEGFVPSDGYYSFESQNGLFYTDYVFALYIVPTDKFSERVDSLILSVNSSALSGHSSVSPLDLTKDNAAAADMLKQLRLNLNYTVLMPGEVYSASLGTIGENKASFSVVEAMQSPGAVVIRSRELNLSVVFIVLAIIALIVLAVPFFSGNKKSSKSQKEATLKTPKRKTK